MLLTAALIVMVLFTLVLDMGFVNHKLHAISIKEAALQSILWIGLSCLFGVAIYYQRGLADASAFYTAYLIQKMLSVDNLFVFMLIFNFFKTPAEYKHKILLSGVGGAFLFRAIFVFAGAAIIEQFAWVLYCFGPLLIYMGLKLIVQKDEEEDNIQDSLAVKLASKLVPIRTDYANGRILSKGCFSMMALVIVTVEIADIIFATDSIPAAFGVTHDPFIIYSANICAVLGLRALFFILDAAADYLHNLNFGVGIILTFIGVKMLLPLIGYNIENLHSLIIVSLILATTALASIVTKHKEI